MGAMKEWYESHIPEMTDEELAELGYDQEGIDFLRECFPSEEQEP